jgi:hypothetical protein
VAVLLGCGMSSSTVAISVTYPLNLIRTRLQAERRTLAQPRGMQQAAARGERRACSTRRGRARAASRSEVRRESSKPGQSQWPGFLPSACAD